MEEPPSPRDEFSDDNSGAGLLSCFAMARRRKRGGRIRRIYRYAYWMLVRKNDQPERVGRGAALGVFIAVFPTLYFGPLIALAVAGPLGANRAAALASMLATGPLMPLIWTGCVLAGNLLVSAERRIGPALIEDRNTAEIVAHFLGTFLLGTLVVGLALALAGYGLAWWLARRYHRARRLRAPARAGVAGAGESVQEAE